MQIILLPADTYIVSNKAVITEYSRKIISMLYQPIIGATATSLYFSFWANLDANQVMSVIRTHHSLMTSMGLSIDDITEAREKLEGIGLIKTYVSKGSINQYIYELYAPLNADEFFINPILSTALCNFIGKQEYDKLVSYFIIPKLNLKNYEEVTCSFHDVFKIVPSTPLEQINNIRTNSKLGLTFAPTIDLNNVLSLIPREMLEHNKITKDMKDFLYKIAFIYNLNDEVFVGIIRDSINEAHLIDKELLKDNCRKYYSFENIGKLPTIVYKNQPEFLRKEITDTSKRSKFIYTMETTSPFDFLTIKNNNIRPSKSDLQILEMLLVDYDLPPGVVNVLIDYVLKINNNKLIKSFIENIAIQWKRSNIKTVEQAMEIATKENSIKKGKSVKVNVNNNVIKEQKPDWFDKDVEINEVTDDEANAFMEKLKKVK